MLQQSCLYARGITPVFSGSPGNGSEAAVNAMAVDASRFTSFVVDGHAQAYVCGFASVYMNGRFVRDGSPLVDSNYGWMGNYRNKSINNMGVFRHLLTQRGFNANITNGSTMLVISDLAPVNDDTAMESWGQLVGYMQRMPLDMLAHSWQEINAGAYGYNGDYRYFKQFSCVMLLLSATNQSMPTAMLTALREAHRNGVHLIVLQKNAYEGNVNFNAIFNPLGIRSNGQAYVVSTPAAHDKSINSFGNHIAWTNVPQLHNQINYRTSAIYQFNTTPAAGPSSLGGQPGTWKQLYCGQVDIPDDIVIDPPIIYRNPCCVEPGSAYGVNFDVTTYPYKPDDWAARMAAGDVSVSWSNQNGQSLQARSKLFSHVVGYQRYLDTGDYGYTVYNGVTYRDTRGLNVYKIRKSDLALLERRSFDIHASAEGTAPGTTNAAACAAFLNSIGTDCYVFVVSYDTADVNRVQGGLPAAMYRIGASRRVFQGSQYVYRAAYCVFGEPGIGEGSAYTELYWGPKSSSPDSYYSVGFDFDSGNVPFCCGTDRDGNVGLGITSLYENTKSAHESYYKVLGGMDGAQTYGMKHTVTIRDNRFKKLPMYETKNFVVSVTNPCFPVPKVQSHDWVHRVNRAGSNYVRYAFKDLNEYLLTTSDGSGQNEMCTSHLMMNWDMFQSVSSGTIYNSAGASHKVYCGTSNGNINDPSSLYINTTEEGKVWHVYERPYQLITEMPERDTNDWQVVWKWNGIGSQGHNIQIEAGYEYIVFAYDRYGEIELAERHFFVPPAEYLPKWGSNYYCRDFSNSTTFTVDRSLRCNAYCEKSSNNGGENGIMMIIRRPLFLTTGAADRTGWECIFNNNGTAVPRGNNYAIPCVKDYQYMVLCSVGDGAYSSHHFNAWNGAFDMVWEGLFEADSGGRASWIANLQTLMQSGNSGGTTMDCFIDSGRASPIGVFQVWRRPILCWEPSEIE
ncbi:hypothetical protein pEaSNUABM22_00108 [Erwinia phage pEa_SNUABM_22]|uniref:ILEI/PANDER domain-containing protein n=1 Tax=Erwinia phage pEa_SNUABM_22 TaxID=2869549 RepID=A0AAE9BUX2_9CAUD|nr:hypothetical protein MPK63_gp108 [Erwinia phage pEa_SNUABM_22]UAW96596.1 hypothetical protein pEaSNUABM22_00108 [Erwinia phage pEa_SNUABM_22]